jgi:hypothetical protein
MDGVSATGRISFNYDGLTAKTGVGRAEASRYVAQQPDGRFSVEKGVFWPTSRKFGVRAPIAINADIIIVSNFKAGNGRSRRYVKRLSRSISRMMTDGKLRIDGRVVYLTTDADPDARIRNIAREILAARRASPPYVIAVGGDGTFADVGAAALIAAEESARCVIVPTPSGTACDMQRELGVPSEAEKLFDFIASALPVKLGAISVRFDGGREMWLMHSMGCGVSGAVFHEVEQERQTKGVASISGYLKGLAKGVIETKTFFASVDDSPRVPVGEVLTLVGSTSIGGVTRVPLPVAGGRLHLIPVDADVENILRLKQGVLALSDVFSRGMRYMLGDERVIAPGQEIAELSAGYTFDIVLGQKRTVEFTDRAGKPCRVKTLLNGDPITSVSRMEILDRGDMIETLSAEHSGFLVRRGEVIPRTPLSFLSERASAVGAAIATGVGKGRVDQDAAFMGTGTVANAAGGLPIILPTTLSSLPFA